MLSKINRLKGKAEFDNIFKKGEKFYSSFFIVYRLKFDEERDPKIGFIASKKVGGAVERNRAKRLLREATRELLKESRSKYDYLLIAKKEIQDSKLIDIKENIKRFWIITNSND